MIGIYLHKIWICNLKFILLWNVQFLERDFLKLLALYDQVK